MTKERLLPWVLELVLHNGIHHTQDVPRSRVMINELYSKDVNTVVRTVLRCCSKYETMGQTMIISVNIFKIKKALKTHLYKNMCMRPTHSCVSVSLSMRGACICACEYVCVCVCVCVWQTDRERERERERNEKDVWYKNWWYEIMSTNWHILL